MLNVFLERAKYRGAPFRMYRTVRVEYVGDFRAQGQEALWRGERWNALKNAPNALSELGYSHN